MVRIRILFKGEQLQFGRSRRRWRRRRGIRSVGVGGGAGTSSSRSGGGIGQSDHGTVIEPGPFEVGVPRRSSDGVINDERYHVRRNGGDRCQSLRCILSELVAVHLNGQIPPTATGRTGITTPM